VVAWSSGENGLWPVTRCCRQAPVGPRGGAGQGRGVGAHQRGESTVRRRKWLRAVAFYGGRGAPVAGGDQGVALQLGGGREG
jgi:hypothetical protein